MTTTQKNRNSGRILNFQALEKRELMAANVSAVMQGKTLVVTGSDNADFVKIFQDRGGISVKQNIGGAWHYITAPSRPIPTDSISKVVADMRGGSDRLDIALNKLNIDTVFANMGAGNGQEIYMHLGTVRSVSVEATESQKTYVEVSGTVRDRIFADFGVGQSNDVFRSRHAKINKLDLRMGGGKDKVYLVDSTVSHANIKLGGHNDFFSMTRSTLASGEVDGGTGENERAGKGWSSQVKFRGFRK